MQRAPWHSETCGQTHRWFSGTLRPITIFNLKNMCISVYISNVSSYLVEALQPLLDLSQCRVRAANFDLWVSSLGMQTISHNSARIAAGKGKGASDFEKKLGNICIRYPVVQNWQTSSSVLMLFCFIPIVNMQYGMCLLLWVSLLLIFRYCLYMSRCIILLPVYRRPQCK